MDVEETASELGWEGLLGCWTLLDGAEKPEPEGEHAASIDRANIRLTPGRYLFFIKMSSFPNNLHTYQNIMCCLTILYSIIPGFYKNRLHLSPAFQVDSRKKALHPKFLPLKSKNLDGRRWNQPVKFLIFYEFYDKIRREIVFLLAKLSNCYKRGIWRCFINGSLPKCWCILPCWLCCRYTSSRYWIFRPHRLSRARYLGLWAYGKQWGFHYADLLFSQRK